MNLLRIVLSLVGAASFFAGCSGAAGGPAGLPAAEVARARSLVQGLGADKISHIVIIVQENRSFDNLFQGVPGADTRSYGYVSSGAKVKLVPVSLAAQWDVAHSSVAFLEACDGQGQFPGTKCKMDGFDKESVTCRTHGQPRCPNKHPQYAYVPRSETKPYFDMAGQYVLADKMFTSNFDGSSFVSHQYIIAAQASASVDVPFGGPWGCGGGGGEKINTVTQERTMGPPISPCFDNQTLGDELDAAGISWKYYTASLGGDGDLWNAFQAIKHIRYGKDWKKIVSPQTRFFDDVSAGKLPAVSWVTPTCGNSDHAACDSKTGPTWVASLVNAIGESSYWKSSAVFVFWDDYGGWYDHVGPKLLDYDGLGFRVPLLVISPYAKKGYVSHVRYEHGSLLRFVEDRFGLAALSASDARATSPQADCFDFGQSPRPFQPIGSPMTVRDFEAQPLDPRIPDAQ